MNRLYSRWPASSTDFTGDTFLGTLRNTSQCAPGYLLIKFFFLSITGQIDWHAPNLDSRICTEDKQSSRALACQAPWKSRSDFYGQEVLGRIRPSLLSSGLGLLAEGKSSFGDQLRDHGRGVGGVQVSSVKRYHLYLYIVILSDVTF
jgi:hypothetical protein